MYEQYDRRYFFILVVLYQKHNKQLCVTYSNILVDRILLQSSRNHGDHSGEPGTIPVQFILKDNSVHDTLARYLSVKDVSTIWRNLYCTNNPTSPLIFFSRFFSFLVLCFLGQVKLGLLLPRRARKEVQLWPRRVRSLRRGQNYKERKK